MDNVQSDLIEWYKLETEFSQDRVRHTKYLGKARNRNEKVKEDWSNCEELGRGGFGVVHKQIEKTTGSYRAVKTIDKRGPFRLDYSRELLVMAILAKRPSLFVEFLGWFEEPETLYIAMEYLDKGDLSKHIGMPLPLPTVKNISKQILEGLRVMHQQGIAHRDLKPANIFVVSMSPVWIKLGDFGVSKRILAQAATTLHTQVSTQAYSAPEVLGLDSNSETSDYTDSVDIWSLGCVVYELLLGSKLFVSEFHLSGYFYGKWPFPEDKLKGLSPPMDDFGISLLKSMLLIQPEDRPTAARALCHGWLAGLRSDYKDSGDDRDEAAQCLGEGAVGWSGGKQLATCDIPKKSSSESPVIQEETRCILREVVLGTNARSQRSGHATSPGAIIDGSEITLLAVASPESSLPPMGLQKLELMPHSLQVTHSASKSAKMLRRKQISTVPQSWAQNLPQAIPQRQTHIVETTFNRPLKQTARLNTCQRKYTRLPPPLLMKLGQELPTGKPTIPDKVDPGRTVPITQGTKPCGIPGLLPVVRDSAEATKSQPSIPCKTLKPAETAMPPKTRIPGKRQLLAAMLTGILMLSGILTGILILAGILTATLILAGTHESEETNISEATPILDGAQTASLRTQRRLRKRHQRRNWVFRRALRE